MKELIIKHIERYIIEDDSKESSIDFIYNLLYKLYLIFGVSYPELREIMKETVLYKSYKDIIDGIKDPKNLFDDLSYRYSSALEVEFYNAGVFTMRIKILLNITDIRVNELVWTSLPTSNKMDTIKLLENIIFNNKVFQEFLSEINRSNTFMWCLTLENYIKRSKTWRKKC